VLLFVEEGTMSSRETASMILSEINSRYGGIPSPSVLPFELFELRTVSYVFVCYQDHFANVPTFFPVPDDPSCPEVVAIVIKGRSRTG
jgi:hypothetical protein